MLAKLWLRIRPYFVLNSAYSNSENFFVRFSETPHSGGNAVFPPTKNSALYNNRYNWRDVRRGFRPIIKIDARSHKMIGEAPSSIEASSPPLQAY